MGSQGAGPDSGGSDAMNAMEILLLAGRAGSADVTPLWGRERALATQYGLAQADALRGMLVEGIFTNRTRLLADVAFSAVPQGAVLGVARASGSIRLAGPIRTVASRKAEAVRRARRPCLPFLFCFRVPLRL
jgi:hypothetical protein